MGKCSEAVLKINLMYEPGEECNRSFPPFVRDVTLENVTSEESKYGIYIIGLDGTVNVSGITLTDCSFNGVQEGASVTGAEDIKLKKVFINGEKLKI